MRHLVWVLCLLLLAGCNEATTGEQFGISSIRQIEPGKTDKATVRALLGAAPQQAIMGKDEETWTYSFSKTGSDAGKQFAVSGAATYGAMIIGSVTPLGGAALAPVALVGTGSTKRETMTDRLVIVFRHNIVSSCKLQHSVATTTVGSGLLNSGYKRQEESKETLCNQMVVESVEGSAGPKPN